MPETVVTLGGWYQRTTLHLSEIYNFFQLGSSHPDLDKDKLSKLHHNLQLTSVTRLAGPLEYIEVVTQKGITLHYYEDGLYTLSLTSNDIHGAKLILESYYSEDLEPAISYIFSLGAPTPKILANIRTLHPVVISSKSEITLAEEYGQIYSSISAHGLTVHKTPTHIFIIGSPKSKIDTQSLVEMQIFFREFKDQLHKYLDIHRRVWEEISSIKDLKSIKGHQIAEYRNRLDSYEKTIDLIHNRINQMGSYIKTRQEIAGDIKLEVHLNTLFQYKFEVLSNTLVYIKEIWNMTRDYVASAITALRDVEARATNNSIRSLQIITSVGVVSGLIGYFNRTELPKLTSFGFVYFLFLCFFTWGLNLIIDRVYKNIRYKLTLSGHTESL